MSQTTTAFNLYGEEVPTEMHGSRMGEVIPIDDLKVYLEMSLREPPSDIGVLTRACFVDFYQREPMVNVWYAVSWGGYGWKGSYGIVGCSQMEFFLGHGYTEAEWKQIVDSCKDPESFASFPPSSRFDYRGQCDYFWPEFAGAFTNVLVSYFKFVYETDHSPVYF